MNTLALEPSTHPRRDKVGAALAGAGLALAVLGAAGELLAGPLYRADVLALPAALGAMRWGTIGALAAAALALLALLLGGRRGRAGVALVIALAAALPPLWLYQRVQTLPRLHDVSTDTSDVPAFAAVLPLRAAGTHPARNPAQWDPATAATQRAGYPDLAPLRLSEPPAQAFERAERAARAMGWSIVATTPAEGRIEATATSRLFGFEDDIVVRVRASDGGSVVDVRSLSRVGGSDFGVNAARVRDYLQRLSAR